MGRIERANRDRLGDARVEALKKKNAEFQAAKKSGNLAQYRKDNPKLTGKQRAQAMFKANQEKKKAEMANEEFTPYEIVLEYLLSTEQAATIEEANYVMTEMDAETIQGIVQEKKEGIFADPKLNKKYSDQPKMTEKGKKILPNLPDPEGMGSKKTKKTPRVFGDPTGEMTKDFFK